MDIPTTGRRITVIHGVPIGDDNNPEPVVEAFSPDGSLLATASCNGVVLLE